jgi:hypothetical protein
MEDLIKSGIRKLVYKLPDGKQYTIISLENYKNASVSDTIRAFKFTSEQAKFDDYYQGINPSEEQRRKYMREVALEIEKGIARYKSIDLPKDWVKLLDNPKKSVQEGILKNAKVNHSQLWGFFLKAEEKGFDISFIKTTHLPNGIKEEDLPVIFEKKNNGEITKYGSTALTDGQLKQVLEHRRVTKAWILEKDDVWMCFFYTYKSMSGKERGNIRHMHFISNAWTKPKVDVINELNQKNYNLNSTWHIEYTETNSMFN